MERLLGIVHLNNSLRKMKLSKEFDISIFEYSDTAKRYGINNNVRLEHQENIKLLHTNMLKVQELLGGIDIWITSGYRSEELNRKVGGSFNSAHKVGLGCDFQLRKFRWLLPASLKLITSDLCIDQVICHDTFIHIAFYEKMRKEFINKQTSMWDDADDLIIGY